jgi:hypothetical protein
LNFNGFMGFEDFTAVDPLGDYDGVDFYNSFLTGEAKLYPKVTVADDFPFRNSNYSLEYAEQINGLSPNLPVLTIANDTNAFGGFGGLRLLSQTAETVRAMSYVQSDGGSPPVFTNIGGSVHTLSGTPLEVKNLIPLLMSKFVDITDFPVPGPLYSYVPDGLGGYHLVTTGVTTSPQIKQAQLSFSRSRGLTYWASPANGTYPTFLTKVTHCSISIVLTKFLIGVHASGFSDWTIADDGASITQLDCSHSIGLEVLEPPKLVSMGGVIADASIDFAASDAVIFRRYAFNGVGLGPSTNPPTDPLGGLSVCTA